MGDRKNTYSKAPLSLLVCQIKGQLSICNNYEKKNANKALIPFVLFIEILGISEISNFALLFKNIKSPIQQQMILFVQKKINEDPQNQKIEISIRTLQRIDKTRRNLIYNYIALLYPQLFYDYVVEFISNRQIFIDLEIFKRSLQKVINYVCMQINQVNIFKENEKSNETISIVQNGKNEICDNNEENNIFDILDLYIDKEYNDKNLEGRSWFDGSTYEIEKNEINEFECFGQNEYENSNGINDQNMYSTINDIPLGKPWYYYD